MSLNFTKINLAMNAAVECARQYVGATSPNPAVGAAALDHEGEIIAVAAHKHAGKLHAERELIELLTEMGRLSDCVTMVVTLEPCSHHGKTPPCADALEEQTQIKRVIYGQKDCNPLVGGKGHAKLVEAGKEVVCYEESPARDLEVLESVVRLNAPFFHWVRTGLPFVIVKVALNREGSMIPAAGQKTFTSNDSLVIAHILRRESGAIITGSGTVLADQPEFTVRHVPDHEDAPSRELVVLDRRGRVPDPKYRVGHDYLTELKRLGKQGVTQVLVEAGVSLTQAVFALGIWNESVIIRQAIINGEPDQIEIKTNVCFQESLNKQL
ncbi:MAG: bifunctional diaminohydroxyphosphoribosylaminopyrimidine deaminase/5-amino-6-(5-phosphoribosylamino)uracil reductase RibD [Xanthomonadaceae bacterium]|nr:bifunctional diaminohydroxyphosphoribosylaminopyrimidine deaminase/5-amino-6-(5-phosphoribosylamino)uracil reductase RibD [Xanthomonadaceae bacterium]